MEVDLGAGEECPEQWAEAGAGWKELETMEQACRCAICGDFFDTPVSVAECGHTFCSLCLRRNLEYQQRSSRALDNSATCPQCRGPASTKSMRLQINLRCVVDSFVKVRERLLDQLKHKPEVKTCEPSTGEKRKQRDNSQRNQHEKEAEEEDHVVIGGRRATRRSARYSSCPRGNSRSAQNQNSQDLTELSDQDQDLQASPTCSDYEMEKSNDLEDDVQLVETVKEEIRGGMQQQTAIAAVAKVNERAIPKGRAQCPICGILVSEALISGHVDVCLEKQERRSSKGGGGGVFGTMSPASAALAAPMFSSPLGRPDQSKLPNKLEPKKLPKLVYHIIKDKELKKYLQRYSLPAAGDRKTLVSRLKEFTHRYNASIDSGNPTTFKRIASAVMEEERCKTVAAQAQASAARVKIDDKKEEDEIFTKMIEQVKRRKLERAEAENGGERDTKENVSPAQAKAKNNNSNSTHYSKDDQNEVLIKVPETLLVVPETVNLLDSSQEIEDSEEEEDDFVIPSQMHPKARRASSLRRRSSRINSQNNSN